MSRQRNSEKANAVEKVRHGAKQGCTHPRTTGNCLPKATIQSCDRRERTWIPRSHPLASAPPSEWEPSPDSEATPWMKLLARPRSWRNSSPTARRPSSKTTCPIAATGLPELGDGVGATLPRVTTSVSQLLSQTKSEKLIWRLSTDQNRPIFVHAR